MNLLLLSREGGCKCHLDLASPKYYLPLLVLFFALCAGLVYAGFRVGAEQVAQGAARIPEQWVAEMETQREAVTEARRNAEEHMNALALRLGQLQAHVIRLDALGKRLVQMANLDNGEFDFDSSPAQGGPASGPADQTSLAVPDFVSALDDISQQLADRERQLTVLSSFLMNSNLQEEVLPAGMPVKNGWISSYFGKRTDPFTGKIGFHEGLDIASKRGTQIVAVGSGVVTFAGVRSKYGNTVEISHGNGYMTRYAHNMKNLVKVGDTVKKGDPVALMGSTGRSTGPHVHFEVHLNNQMVDPLRFVQAER